MMKRPRFGEVFFVANGAQSLLGEARSLPRADHIRPYEKKREWGALFLFVVRFAKFYLVDEEF